MPFVVAIIAAVLGAKLNGAVGLVVGALLGFYAAFAWQQRRELNGLRQRVDALEAATIESSAASDASSQGFEDLQTASAQTDSAAEAKAISGSDVPAMADNAATQDALYSQTAAALPEATTPEPSAFEHRMAQISIGIKKLFTTGNVVARVGAIILFFGIAFLLRYAYENAMLPVELRLSGAALGGIALAVVGWRLRTRADTYGLILQGAGIGLLYLSIFAAARLYDLLPLGAALVMLVVLVTASSLLAVVQKSQALAIFAMSGGFLAPVLMSTGTGSHVALFSYYALLNSGILAMAWFQFWRWLNWVGFIFTFAIGGIWGYQYYQPELFASTEPFLLLFFLFYIGVSVLFARRKDVELRGVIDGTLVFGTPVIAFALQAALVREMEFGLAFSALGAGLTYTLLALWLKRLNVYSLLLGQSFIALGVAFATLAIPFAFDNQRFTGATWALEGAALFWVGLQQQQRLPRAFGILLQLAAAAAFIIEGSLAVAPTPFLNSAFLGAAMLSLAGGFTAFELSSPGDRLHRFERPLRWLFLLWSILWWFAGGIRELARYLPSAYDRFVANNVNENLFILFAAASLAALRLIAARLRWSEGLLPGFLLLPVLVASLIGLDLYWDKTTAFADLGWIAWPIALAVLIWHLHGVEAYPRLNSTWHAGTWWFLSLFVAWNAVALAQMVMPYSVWSWVLWGAVPLAVASLLIRFKRLRRWPFDPFRESYFGLGWGLMLGYLLIWLVKAGTEPADPSPLPYLVLVNPLELVQLAILLSGLLWTRTFADSRLHGYELHVRIIIAAAAFIWLNLTAARAVHVYVGIAYPMEYLLSSDAFQSTASILWTITALVLMAVGAKKLMRLVWITGAGLLGLVILKLFTVDMSNLDMVARIVSFITVGVLMLVIGYLAPLPPKRKTSAAGKPITIDESPV